MITDELIVNLLAKSPLTVKQMLNKVSDADLDQLQKVLLFLVKNRTLFKLATGAYGLSSNSYGLFNMQANQEQFEEIVSSFPLQHELDNDWRFTFNDGCKIIRLASHNILPNSKICCVGTPTLALLLALSEYPAKILLVERNAKICNALSLVKSDILSIINDDVNSFNYESYISHFDAVFLDPPWVMSSILKFTDLAYNILLPGGVFSMITFPIYHHERSLEESASILSYLVDLGLSPLTLLQDEIEYKRKPTVQELERLDVSEVDSMRGNLIICEKTVKSFLNEDNTMPQNLKNIAWEDFYVGRSKISIRLTDEKSYTQPQVIDVIPEKDKMFISNSDPRAIDIDLWTSGNQVYKIKGINVVRELLTCILENLTLDETAERMESVFLVPKIQVLDDIKECFMVLKLIIKKEMEIDNFHNGFANPNKI